MSILNKSVKENLIGNIHLLKKVQGYSAYDLAVSEGFKGTLQEWLESLKGADGYTPVKGKDYFDGEKGDPGTLESHTEVDALGHRVVNVAEPTEDTDAVNLGFVKTNCMLKCRRVNLVSNAPNTTGKFWLDSFFKGEAAFFVAVKPDLTSIECKKIYHNGDDSIFHMVKTSTGEDYTDNDIMVADVYYFSHVEDMN